MMLLINLDYQKKCIPNNKNFHRSSPSCGSNSKLLSRLPNSLLSLKKLTMSGLECSCFSSFTEWTSDIYFELSR